METMCTITCEGILEKQNEILWKTYYDFCDYSEKDSLEEFS